VSAAISGSVFVARGADRAEVFPHAPGVWRRRVTATGGSHAAQGPCLRRPRLAGRGAQRRRGRGLGRRNDIGFTSILENCATANPFAHPCRDKYVVNGHDTLADRIAATASKVAAVLAGIHARSPGARVFVVDYAAILPETGSGCWPQVPIAFSDVPYLRSVEKNLNAMLAQQAAANDARIVDDYTASIGRDACKSSSTRWVEPLVPANAAAPFHPNARGEAGIATVVVGAVSR
jgi:hypothetical protein